MPRRPRVATAGIVYHAMNRGAKKSRLFDCDRDYAAFQALLNTGVSTHAVALYAYCLMPTHWHLVIAPREDGALSRCLHWVTTTHARRWQLFRGRDGEGAVYQGRFKAIPVQADAHFLTVCRYVERNALRAGLVERAEDWEWCSLSQRAVNPVLAPWPIPCPANWIVEVNKPQTTRELEAVRGAIVRNHPFGSAEWREAVSRDLRIRLPRRMSPDPLTDLYS